MRDQDIEALFHVLDQDRCASRGHRLERWPRNQRVDLNEFVHGYKVAKLFMELDKADVNQSDEASMGPAAEYTMNVDIDIQREGHGITITVPLAPGTATDLRRSFMNGMPLAAKYAEIVVKEATAVFKQQPNAVRLEPPTPESRLTIVGDLHGSLSDLHCIFEEIGTPSAQNRILFNGDFVDRGKDGVEVLLILLAYKVLHPDYVHLNRGNHEDLLVNQSYGFMKECTKKYSKRMFALIIKMFQHLPLCAIVGGGSQCAGKGIFVVHGGLFSDPGTTLDRINEIERTKYQTVIVQTKTPTIYDTLIEEMLWSDPTPDQMNGVYASERGSGVEFGPDVTLRWLQQIGCNTLVRSHECIEDGCEYLPVKDTVHGSSSRTKYSLYTIFSASNYSDGDNQGAVLTFTSLDQKPKVFRFRSTVKPPDSKLVGNNRLRLADMLFRRHYRLLRAFQQADTGKTGSLSEKVVADVLKQALHLDINWAAVLPSLMGEPTRREGLPVDYEKFLSRYTVRQQAAPAQQAELSAMYDKFGLLKSTFDYWDEDNDGKINFEEFSKGIEAVNKVSETSLDASELFELLDLDHSGEVDMNEFCEAFRLTRDAVL